MEGAQLRRYLSPTLIDVLVLSVVVVVVGTIAKDLLGLLGAGPPHIPLLCHGRKELFQVSDIVELALTTSTRGEGVLTTLGFDSAEKARRLVGNVLDGGGGRYGTGGRRGRDGS